MKTLIPGFGLVSVCVHLFCRNLVRFTRVELRHCFTVEWQLKPFSICDGLLVFDKAKRLSGNLISETNSHLFYQYDPCCGNITLSTMDQIITCDAKSVNSDTAIENHH